MYNLRRRPLSARCYDNICAVRQRRLLCLGTRDALQCAPALGAVRKILFNNKEIMYRKPPSRTWRSLELLCGVLTIMLNFKVCLCFGFLYTRDEIVLKTSYVFT